MSARTKLNVAYANGCLIVAAVFGVLGQSWLLFFLVLAVTLFGGWYCGDIRAKRGSQHRSRQ